VLEQGTEFAGEGGSDRTMEKFHREEIHDLCYLTVLLGWKKLRSMKWGGGTLARVGQKKRSGVWFKTEIPGGNLRT
jgi:hypothetical protein